MFRVASALVFVPAIALTGCFGGDALTSAAKSKTTPSHINNTTKFSEAAYGVAASPRVTTSKVVRKGGGRRQVGKPYKIKGKWYTPKEEPGYERSGQASWYGPNFHGRLTANGEVYDQFALSGAHPTFPLPSYARVTNLKNGRSVIVRVNDRGPYHEGRIIDLSGKAAGLLDYRRAGVAQVKVNYIGMAPLHGRDASYLEASYKGGGDFGFDEPTAVASAQPSTSLSRIAQSRRMRLDDIKTGSIGEPTEMPDEFFDDLQAIKAGESTETTLSLRLQRSGQTQYR